MSKIYDKHYQTAKLFGEPYPELIRFFEEYPERGKLLDLGCGQGRNALPLTKMGYDLTAIDISKLGIQQLLAQAKTEKLNLTSLVMDIYKFADFANFDFILVDSMLHFYKNHKKKESDFIRKIIHSAKVGALLIICLPDSNKKIKTLQECFEQSPATELILDSAFKYQFVEQTNNHVSVIDYRMIVRRKVRDT